MNTLRIIDQSFPSAFLQFAYMDGERMVGQVFCNATPASHTFRAIREWADGRQEVCKFSTLDAAMNFAVSGECDASRLVRF